MPAPMENGLPGKRALDSEEAGRWLRALLELSDHDVSERKVSSHSLKCTMLSFLAKRGSGHAGQVAVGVPHVTFHYGTHIQQGWHGTSSSNLRGNAVRNQGRHIHA